MMMRNRGRRVNEGKEEGEVEEVRDAASDVAADAAAALRVHDSVEYVNADADSYAWTFLYVAWL